MRRGRDDHVVGELVLDHDLDDVPAAREAEPQQFFECVEPGRGHLRYDSAVRASVLALIVATGCVRDPASAECPDVGVGDLVVTEIAGPQTGSDTLAPWVELYNASGKSIDLYGLRLNFRNPTGDPGPISIVRRSLEVEAGSYTVLGLDDDADHAAYLDYGMAADFHASWPSGAVLDVDACGTVVDRAQYSSLPKTGTYSLGTQPPTADANDLPANWCTDTTPNTGSFPGTPQRANTACP